jgi:hypothetical protein
LVVSSYTVTILWAWAVPVRVTVPFRWTDLLKITGGGGAVFVTATWNALVAALVPADVLSVAVKA